MSAESLSCSTLFQNVSYDYLCSSNVSSVRLSDDVSDYNHENRLYTNTTIDVSDLSSNDDGNDSNLISNVNVNLSTNSDDTNATLPVQRGITISHLNIVTLPGKIDQVKYFMQNNPVHVMAFTETRLDKHISDNVVAIDDCTLYRKDRNSSGGGVAMYVNNVGIQHKLRQDLIPESLELIAVEIKYSMTKPIVVIAWYRGSPDKSIDNFDVFESVLQQIETENKDVVLIGDFNCDLLAVTHDCYTKRLINICNGFNYVQLITEPTRVTETTESLLDHVYVTNEENVSISGVIHTGLSDHSLVYACIGKSKKVPTQSHKLKTSRSFSKFNEDDFINDIRKADWKSVKYDCVNKSVDEFEELFTNIADKHAPMKTKRVRKKQSPWLNDDIIALM